MLRKRQRIVEPREVGDVQHQRRRRAACVPCVDDLGTEQILVANVDGHLLAAQCERLRRRTPLLIANRHLHQIDEPSEAGRNELTERHQMTLAVATQGRVVRRSLDPYATALLK